MLSGARYPFRVSSGQGADGNGTRVHLNIDPGERALPADLDGVLNFEARAPRFEGALTLVAPAGQKAQGRCTITPWRIAAKVKADHVRGAARTDRGELRPRGARAEICRQRRHPLRRVAAAACGAVGAAARCRQVRRQGQCRRAGSRAAGAARAASARFRSLPIPAQIELSVRADHAGRPPVAGYCRRAAWRRQILEPATTGVSRARRDPGFAERRRRARTWPGSFQGRAQRRIVRSGCAGDLAAGPRRYRLSQPEAAAAARRRDRGAGRLCDRRHEGRDRGGAVEGRVAGIASAGRSAARGSRRS